MLRKNLGQEIESAFSLVVHGLRSLGKGDEMKIFMIWGQRECRYEGQYAPELLGAIDEYSDDENSQWLNDEYKKHCDCDHLESVALFEAEIDDEQITKELSIKKIDMKNVTPI